MKKNIMMRAASALLVAVLLTTCSISGTFAKYTTAANVTDIARVAKWGVEIKSSGDMFGQKYYNVDATDSNKVAETTVVNSISVASAGNDNVLAPGTKGELAKTTITGTPEVSVEVTYEPILTLTGWTVDGNEYCPLLIKVADKTYGITDQTDNSSISTGCGCSDIATLKSSVENAIKAAKGTYDPNTKLEDKTVAVSWEWPFEHGADDAAKAANDAKDTALGNAEIAPTIKFGIKTTVTQLD